MRRYTDKEKKSHFKGSIFIQFKTLDSAKAFMEQEAVKYEDTELIRKFVYVLTFCNGIMTMDNNLRNLTFVIPLFTFQIYVLR